MRRNLSCAIASGLLLLALAASAVAAASIDAQIYTTYSNEGYCVKVAHQTGWIGCALPPSGTHGRLRLALTQAAIDAISLSPPSYAVTLIMPVSLLRAATMLQLAAAGINLAGIMVLPQDGGPTSANPDPRPPGGYSPAPSQPQMLPYFPSQPAIPNRPAVQPMFNNNYTWNPQGDGLSLMQFPFAIVTIIPKEIPYLMSLAQQNEAHEAAGEFVDQEAEFFFYMYAHGTSVNCLYDATCVPVGGYSVWGSLGNMTHNSTDAPVPLESIRPIVLALAKMDTNSFFHQLAPGAEDAIASVSVLIAAMKILANTPGIDRLPSQILFALFDGESYSHVGSRKFVDDIQHFVCLDNNAGDSAGTGAECSEPFKNTLDFLDVHLEKIEKIFEVGMVGMNDTVFLHRQRDGNAVTSAMINSVRRAAGNMTINPISVGDVDSDTPGIPPSCAEAFLQAKPSIGTVVLTDHAGPFATAYWQSQFDTYSDLPATYVPRSSVGTHRSLCTKAELLARSLWVEAGGAEELTSNFAADCDLLDAILDCMLVNPSCDLANQVAAGALGGSTPPSHYPSVYQLLPTKYLGDTPVFLYGVLNTFILNATSYVQPDPAAPVPEGGWPAAPSNLHYHDAVDPNLLFIMDANRWVIKPDANDFPVWTESNWDGYIKFRTYRVEDPKTEAITFIAGIAVALATVGAIYASKAYCNKKFKTL